MKIRYDKEDDVMMIWLSDENVDYAEQSKNVIIHFSKDDRPVLMEILDAQDFYKKTSNKFPASVRRALAG